MNQPFYFSPTFNPYQDNPRYVRKALSSRLLLLCCLGICLMLITMIFGAACFFNLHSITPTIETQTEEFSNMILGSSEGITQIFYSIVLFLPFLGFIILLFSRHSEAFGTVPFTLYRVFLALVSFLYITSLFDSAITPFMDQMMFNDTVSEQLLYSLLLNGIPALLGLVWAVFGFLFCGSVSTTIKCKALNNQFSKLYMISSFLYVISLVGTTVVYCLRDFSGGMFPTKSTASSVKSIIIHSMPIAPVMFCLFYTSAAVVLVATALLAKQYMFAIEDAKKSFRLTGSNLYMNSDSHAADYYQQTYTAPSAPDVPTSAAPASVDLGFRRINPTAFQPSPPLSGTPGTPYTASSQNGTGLYEGAKDMNQRSGNVGSVPAIPSAPPAAVPDTLSVLPSSDEPSIINGTYICPYCKTINDAGNKICSACKNTCFRS